MEGGELRSLCDPCTIITQGVIKPYSKRIKQELHELHVIIDFEVKFVKKTK